MNQPTTTEGVRTRYAEETIPATCAGWSVKPLYEHPTMDGVSYAAEVCDSKRLLGTIENEGRGGGTWFRPADAAARKLWDACVEVMAALDPESAFVAHEHLANVLYEDAALFRDMNRKRKIVFVPADKSPADPDAIMVLNAPTGDEAALAWVRSNYPGARVWVKRTGWVAL